MIDHLLFSVIVVNVCENGEQESLFPVILPCLHSEKFQTWCCLIVWME